MSTDIANPSKNAKPNTTRFPRNPFHKTDDPRGVVRGLSAYSATSFPELVLNETSTLPQSDFSRFFRACRYLNGMKRQLKNRET